MNEEQVIDPPVEEAPIVAVEAPPKVEPAAPTAAQVEETNRILKEVGERLKPPAGGGPTRDQVRDIIREKTGLSDAGIDWVMEFNRESVVGAVAPLASRSFCPLSWVGCCWRLWRCLFDNSPASRCGPSLSPVFCLCH